MLASYNTSIIFLSSEYDEHNCSCYSYFIIAITHYCIILLDLYCARNFLMR